jgi:hypothetical protein
MYQTVWVVTTASADHLSTSVYSSLEDANDHILQLESQVGLYDAPLPETVAALAERGVRVLIEEQPILSDEFLQEAAAFERQREYERSPRL